MPAELIAFDTISKRFGGTHALRDVSLQLMEGEILALLGENGAGKSTLIKVLAGIFKQTSGEIRFRGTPYQHRPSRPNERQPVAFIHQDLGLIEWMTVAENMGLAQGFVRRYGLIDWNATAASGLEALRLVGIGIDPETRVKDLTRTEKSLVAIARALAVDADVLVLDEPTASLPANEVDQLFDALRPLKSRGVGIIYVSHRLDEIFRIADRVAVLRDGRLIGQQPVAGTTPEDLVQMIVGRPAAQLFKKAPLEAGETMLEVRGMRCARADDVSFDLKRGELLGLVGLRGAGHENIGRALFGDEPFAGSVTLLGERPDLSSPRTAMASGIGLVARDRTEESVAMALNLRENIFINPSASGRPLWSFRSPRTEAQFSYEIGERVGLRPNDQELPIEALSGGNQQKVVVGRWLATDRRLLIAEDPTAGVDVGAKAEIYRLIAKALGEGLGVIVVSTDFEEVANICHRVLVFSRGRIVQCLEGEALTTAAVIHAASASEAA